MNDSKSKRAQETKLAWFIVWEEVDRKPKIKHLPADYAIWRDLYFCAEGPYSVFFILFHWLSKLRA